MSNVPQLHRNDFFDLFPSFFGGDSRDSLSLRDMAVDIKEDDKSYTVTADLPGFNKENIHVDFDHGLLSIEGKRSDEVNEKDEAGNYIRRERSSGTFRRSFALQNVDADQINAEFKDGVLKIDLPKAAGKSTKKIEVK